MTSSLVGSEMCIRDRKGATTWEAEKGATTWEPATELEAATTSEPAFTSCLLYTSDAADDM
eukprot:7759461-Prorocentrum_lima.AAC.1